MSNDEQAPLRKIQLYGWLVLLVAVGLGGVFAGDGRLVAGSVLVGGLIANISFWLLKKDLTRLLQGELTAVKGRFFIKYYARLTVIAVILFLIIRYRTVSIAGLLAGLSTIFISIALVAVLNAGKGLNS